MSCRLYLQMLSCSLNCADAIHQEWNPQIHNSASRGDPPTSCRQHMPQSCFIYFCSRFSKVVWCLFQKPHVLIHLLWCHASCICKCPPPPSTPPNSPPSHRKLNCADASHQECSPQCPTLHQELTSQIHAGNICPKAVSFIFATDFLKLFGACSRNLIFQYTCSNAMQAVFANAPPAPPPPPPPICKYSLHDITADVLKHKVSGTGTKQL